MASGLPVAAYTKWFGTPTTNIRAVRALPSGDIDVVVYLPDDAEREDPEGNITLLGTAGLHAVSIVRDGSWEIGIEIKGTTSDDVTRAVAQELVDLGCTPLATGRPFSVNQVLSN